MKKVFRFRNLEQVRREHAQDRAIERAVRSVTDEQFQQMWGYSIDECVESIMKRLEAYHYFHCTPEGHLMMALIKSGKLPLHSK
jgi:hypothetical protein